MSEFSNNKQRNVFIFGLVTLLLLVLGASYAYFAVTTVSNFGTSIINAEAGEIGSVTLNGSNAILSMDITALDMVQQCEYELIGSEGNDWYQANCSNQNYYASSSGTTTNPTVVSLGSASVSSSTDANYYHCSYTLNLTHSGTRDMYNIFNSQTNNAYDYANRSYGQIVLTVNRNSYDFYESWPSTISGDFYTTYGDPAYITAGLMLTNDGYTDQTYLADSYISISVSVAQNSFSCAPISTPTITYWGNKSNQEYVTTSNATKEADYNDLDIDYSYFIKETDFGSTKLYEMCYDTGSVPICMKPGNWVNVSTYKTALESEGFTCTDGTSDGYLSCSKNNLSFSYYMSTGFVDVYFMTNNSAGCFVAGSNAACSNQPFL
jgi:hypothetical protein